MAKGQGRQDRSLAGTLEIDPWLERTWNDLCQLKPEVQGLAWEAAEAVVRYRASWRANGLRGKRSIREATAESSVPAGLTLWEGLSLLRYASYLAQQDSHYWVDDPERERWCSDCRQARAVEVFSLGHSSCDACHGRGT